MAKNIQKFQIKNLPCEKVVVYVDKAEVKRSLKVKLETGENEIIISNVSNLIDQESIRVDGIGEATVLDVVCEKKHVEVNEADVSDKIKELKEKINELENKENLMNIKNQRIDSQLKILHEFANTLSKPTSNNSQNKDNASPENTNSFLQFIDTYGKRVEEIDNEKYLLNQEKLKNQKQLDTAKNSLATLNVTNSTAYFEITILLDAKSSKNEANFYLSYVILNASWGPKYDIRVFSNKKDMIINYYGLIQQSTGEDWNDTKISLSTALPSIGGNVPELGTMSVGIKQIYHRGYEKSKLISFSNRASSRKLKMTLEDASDCEDFEMSMSSSRERRNSIQALKVLTTEVREGMIASTFDIPRQATVPSDNSTHKVSIGILNLKPEFEYETVPKKTPYAFLKAKVKNTSLYAIIGGPANVFLDNNFVAKTEVNSTGPQGEFTCSLGVDPSIKIDYKPIRKFQEEHGYFGKTRVTKYVQIIEITNSNTNPIKLLLSEQLPLSNNEQIQVKLSEPQLKNSHNVKLNKSNNLVFNLNIDAGKKEEVTVKYSIENSTNSELEFS